MRDLVDILEEHCDGLHTSSIIKDKLSRLTRGGRDKWKMPTSIKIK